MSGKIKDNIWNGVAVLENNEQYSLMNQRKALKRRRRK